jgi:hypothetical protein
VCISYRGEIIRLPRDGRQSFLKDKSEWHFDCQCQRCTSPTDHHNTIDMLLTKGEEKLSKSESKRFVDTYTQLMTAADNDDCDLQWMKKVRQWLFKDYTNIIPITHWRCQRMALTLLPYAMSSDKALALQTVESLIMARASTLPLLSQDKIAPIQAYFRLTSSTPSTSLPRLLTIEPHALTLLNLFTGTTVFSSPLGQSRSGCTC